MCHRVAAQKAVFAVDADVQPIGDGGVEVEAAVFSGPNARARAIDYARHRFGDFDEIELEPY